jgi:hypothetical protein
MSHRPNATVADPELERQGKRLGRPAIPFLLIALGLAAPGLVMLILGSSWVWAIGIALVAISLPAATVGVGAALSASIARWAARHRSFA